MVALEWQKRGHVCICFMPSSSCSITTSLPLWLSELSYIKRWVTSIYDLISFNFQDRQLDLFPSPASHLA
jgi:hypothetical protein